MQSFQISKTPTDVLKLRSAKTKSVKFFRYLKKTTTFSKSTKKKWMPFFYSNYFKQHWQCRVKPEIKAETEAKTIFKFFKPTIFIINIFINPNKKFI